MSKTTTLQVYHAVICAVICRYLPLVRYLPFLYNYSVRREKTKF